MAQEMSPNQVVAWNIWSERKARGWSQQDVSARLARYGIAWENPATYYAVEASRHKPTRRFSADELLALAQVFDKPVTAFLTPPEGTSIVLGDEAISLADLVESGLHQDIGDTRPLADRLRLAAAALDAFEEQRGGEGESEKSAAARIVDHATAPNEASPLSHDIGRRQTEKELEEMKAWRIEQGIDPDDPAKRLTGTDEEERGSA